MCDLFDEGLFTYRRLGAAGGVANQLRQLRLRQALSEALGIKHGCFSGMTQSSPDKSNEVLRNGQTVLETYVKKIAQILLIDDAAASMSPETLKTMERNEEFVKELFGEACRLLDRSNGKFLFSDNLSSADGFLISIVFRIGDCDKTLLQSLF